MPFLVSPLVSFLFSSRLHLILLLRLPNRLPIAEQACHSREQEMPVKLVRTGMPVKRTGMPLRPVRTGMPMKKTEMEGWRG